MFLRWEEIQNGALVVTADGLLTLSFWQTVREKLRLQVQSPGQLPFESGVWHVLRASLGLLQVLPLPPTIHMVACWENKNCTCECNWFSVWNWNKLWNCPGWDLASIQRSLRKLEQSKMSASTWKLLAMWKKNHTLKTRIYWKILKFWRHMLCFCVTMTIEGTLTHSTHTYIRCKSSQVWLLFVSQQDIWHCEQCCQMRYVEVPHQQLGFFSYFD